VCRGLNKLLYACWLCPDHCVCWFRICGLSQNIVLWVGFNVLSPLRALNHFSDGRQCFIAPFAYLMGWVALSVALYRFSR